MAIIIHLHCRTRHRKFIRVVGPVIWLGLPQAYFSIPVNIKPDWYICCRGLPKRLSICSVRLGDRRCPLMTSQQYMIMELELETVRIRCSPTTNKTNIYDGLEDVVRAAIFLSEDQAELAVEPYGILRVNQRFTNLTHLRLLSSDPLFSTGDCCTYAQAALAAFIWIRQQYCNETNNDQLLWDQRLANWFITNINHFDTFIKHYRRQCQHME